MEQAKLKDQKTALNLFIERRTNLEAQKNSLQEQLQKLEEEKKQLETSRNALTFDNQIF